MKILCITGLPAAGKSVFFKEVQKKGWSGVIMGDIVRDRMKREGLDVNNKSLREYASNLRDKYGNGIVGTLTANKIRDLNSQKVIVDGVRGLSEIEEFKKLGDVKIIYVFASPEVRFMRILSRGRPDDPKTFDEFLWREKKEREWGLCDVILSADEVVPNNGTLSEFKARINELLGELNE